MTSPGFVIVGAGGHGREVLDLVEASGRRGEFVGFVDDSALSTSASERIDARDAHLVGDVAWLRSTLHGYVLGIGTSAARRDIVERLAGGAGGPITLCDPTSLVGSRSTLGAGVLLCARTVVTTNVTIGDHTHLNVGCVVQHDSMIGEFTTLSPGVHVNGDVTIGADVFVGTGAIVTRGCTVGDGAVVGAGAVVLTDVEPGSRVFGVPARP